MEDFNEITKAEEKKGGAIRRERQMRDFREALDFLWISRFWIRGISFHMV